jgi:hypothetical protein
MTIDTEGRDETQCRPAGGGRGARIVTAIALVLALSVSGPPLPGHLSAHAAEITFQCVNPASGTMWSLKINDERQTVDSLPAQITTTRIMWRDSVRGGFYELDRKSGLLTFHNASSTGGYILYHQCHMN